MKTFTQTIKKEALKSLLFFCVILLASACGDSHKKVDWEKFSYGVPHKIETCCKIGP